MSVVVGERNETKLEVLLQAEKLAGYTVNIVSNEKHFPKRYRWCLNDELVKKAISIVELVNGANSVYPKTKSDYEVRRSVQMEALAEMGKFLALIATARACFGIKLEAISYWIDTATYTKTIMQKWIQSDCVKFGGLPD
ncbi:MAG: hypothetical protein LKG11_00660 [Bacilli bacterium]|jgi:hypothetical protein|nr:hypothetical protein [Bacilli bacterium]